MLSSENCRNCHRYSFFRNVAKRFKIRVCFKLLFRLRGDIYKSYPSFIIEISIKRFVQGQMTGRSDSLT